VGVIRDGAHDRFPADFAFQVTAQELPYLRSQFATSSSQAQESTKESGPVVRFHGGRRYLPWAFTEHGALMVATVLNSPKAVAMSVYVVRAFVQMRDRLAANLAFAKRIAEIDRTLLEHDSALRDIYRKLLPLLLSLYPVGWLRSWHPAPVVSQSSRAFTTRWLDSRS